jgi:hypothetical protein
MSRLNVSNLFNENEDGAPVVSGISTFSSPHYFVPPSGSTAQRPSNPGEGMIRFNTDSGHLEYYTGELWVDVITNNNELGNQLVTTSAGGTGTRGIIGGRATPGFINNIDYFTISTLGNAQDFGDMSTGRYLYGTFASSTRGVFTGGNGQESRIESITIASTGDAVVDSGTLSTGRYLTIGCSNSIRGLTGGGTPYINNIDSTIIASLGNAEDFGDLSIAVRQPGAYASPVRGIFAGGYAPGPSAKNTIEYVTISTTGNTQDFGDLTRTAGGPKGTGSATRAVFGGMSFPTNNDLLFITMASTGNAQDFGDLISSLSTGGSFSSVTRGVYAGGLPGNSATCESVEIATTGNALDFGDLSTGGHGGHGMSNGHGGL